MEALHRAAIRSREISTRDFGSSWASSGSLSETRDAEPIMTSSSTSRANASTGDALLSASHASAILRQIATKPATEPSVAKHSIAFILDVHVSVPRKRTKSAKQTSGPKAQQEQLTQEQKKMARACRVEGCNKYTIDKGLCFRHGGGKVCAMEGCERSAKRRGLCWRHGGFILCSVAGCEKGAKTRGLCWAHGGGMECSVESCGKAVVSNGLCWSHGGGIRCSYDGCNRKAARATMELCKRHYKQLHSSSALPTASHQDDIQEEEDDDDAFPSSSEAIGILQSMTRSSS